MSATASKIGNKIHGSLFKRLQAVVPEKQAELIALRKQYGNKVIENVTVNQVIGGMRGMTGLIYETSKLDAYEGIRYRGLSLREVQEQCPKFVKGGSPAPEGVLWLLLTGEVPTEDELQEMKVEMNERSYIPPATIERIRNLPKDMHPMTQLSIGVLACQPQSSFAQQYREGIPKAKYWEAIYDDCLDVIAKTPKIAALIYNN